MSDGGKESGRDNENNSGSCSVSGGDDFGRAVSRIAVAQICESAGFHSFQRSALDALSDVAIRYISNLGRTAQFYASLSGRTSCNVLDIIQGLEDLESLHGFPAASDIHHCLIGSSIVQGITQYVSIAEEVPFARPVPHFPITWHRKPAPTFAQIGETPAGKHIPDWLPAFPDPHTYIHTPVWGERVTDPRAEKIEQVRQRRKAEQSLLSLQQRLACNSMEGPISVDDGDAEKGKRLDNTNPFLTPPLLYGKKEVSPIVVPAEAAVESKVSVLETFAPAIEAVEGGALDSGACERKVVPKKRPGVYFKLGIDKKSMVSPLSSNTPSAGKAASWFLKDDEKDDKKRRAELILKEAMENPQELAQL